MTPTARKHALIDLQRLDAKQWLPQQLETPHCVLHVYWKQGLKDAYPAERALLAATALMSGNEPASICAVLHSPRWSGISATVGGDTPKQMSIGNFRAVWSHVCVAATCVPDHDHFWDRTGTRLVRRAEWIAHWIAEDKQNWYTLEASEQNLWTNMGRAPHKNSTTYCAHRQECAMREPGREWPTCKRLSEPVLHNLASREVVSRFG